MPSSLRSSIFSHSQYSRPEFRASLAHTLDGRMRRKGKPYVYIMTLFCIADQQTRTWHPLHLLHLFILVERVPLWVVADRDAVRFDKSAMPRSAIEVVLAVDCTVILTNLRTRISEESIGECERRRRHRFVVFDSDPCSSLSERHFTDKADESSWMGF